MSDTKVDDALVRELAGLLVESLNLEMAADGFHPSKEIYQIWAQEAAAKIRRKF